MSRAPDCRPSFVVLQTYCVDPPRRRRQAPYFEITLGADTYPDAPRTILITRDPAVYARALAAEGTDQPFTIDRHFERGELLLDALHEVSV